MSEQPGKDGADAPKEGGGTPEGFEPPTAPYGQPPVSPYGQPGPPPVPPYAQPSVNPYAQPGQPSSYGQPPAAPYGQPPVSPYGPPGYYGMPAEPKGMSIASLVCGLASVFLGWFFFLPQLAAIILGHLALRREPSGKGMSITGLALGYLSLLAYAFFGLFWLFIVFYAAQQGGDIYR